MSKLFILAFAVEIVLGVVLILFTLLNRARLPRLSRMIFFVIGILMILACLLMCAGLAFAGS